jgi:hypothetical protein
MMKTLYLGKNLLEDILEARNLCGLKNLKILDL